MASRITVYGTPKDPNVKRLQREMNALYVEHEDIDIDKDTRARTRLKDTVGEVRKWPLVEIQRADGDGSVFLSNPDEPTLRHSLYSEEILSITSYWV